MLIAAFGLHFEPAINGWLEMRAREFSVLSVDESKTSRKNARKNARTLEGERALQAPILFYKKRNRFYTLLLLLVVVIGLPIVGVPHLRNRLSARILQLKAAAAGNVNPIVAQVGANKEPFPSEYEKPKPPVHQVFRLPPAATVIPQSPKVYIPTDSSSIEAAEVLNLEGSQVIYEGEDSTGPDDVMLGEAEEPGPKYQQGEIEQDAYNLLLEANTRIAEMVRGSDSSMIFDSWDAAHRGDDIYWVRVKFRSGENPVREYIWQVSLNSQEIIPLSYHARSIS